MIRTLLYFLTATLFLLPGSASAVGTDFYAVTEWNNPIPTQFYSFGDDITLTGTWQLPLDWAGHIYVFVDGVQKSSKTGDPYIAIKNLSSEGATATTTGLFNFNIGPQLDGNHTVYVEFWGGEECAINAQLNAKYGTTFTPTCPVVTNTANDNFLPKQIYPSRVFSVGLPPFPRIVITPDTNPSLNFANIVNGTTDIRTISIKNTGGQTLTGQATGFALPFRCYGTPICDYVVTPGTTKVISVQFVPEATNNYENTISFSCAGSSYACDFPTLTRRIVGNSTGAAVPPQVSVTPNPVDFGTVNVGGYSNRVITIRNSGGGLLTGEGTPPADYICTPNCSYSLYSGESVPKTLRFAPTSGSGARTDVATFNGGIMQNVNLTSVVNDLPVISVTPTSYTIPGRPNVGGPPYVLVYYVRNLGSGLLTGTVLGLPTPGNTYTCISGCNYNNLAPGAAAWPVTVHFNAIDDTVNAVTMEFTNTLGASQFVTTSGQGNVLPVVSIAGGTTYNFGTVVVGQTTTRTITVTNTGVGILNFTPSVTAGGTVYTCITNCGAQSVAAGTSVTFTVQFAPDAAGTFPGAMNVAGINVTLSGVGTIPSFDVQALDIKTGAYYPLIPDDTPILTNGGSISGISGDLYSKAYYIVSIPEGTTNFKVSTVGGPGDADLYVKRGQPPTLSSYDRVSGGAYTTESVTYPAPTSGTYYVFLSGYSPFTGLTISVSYTGAGIPPPIEPQVVNYGTTTIASPVENKMNYYKLANTGTGASSYTIADSPHFVLTNSSLNSLGCPAHGSGSSGSMPFSAGGLAVGAGGCSYYTAAPVLPRNATTALIEFRPAGTPGEYAENLSIQYNHGGPAKTISFIAKGVAIAAPYQTVSPLWVWYPDINVGVTATTAVIVKNEGTGILNGTASFERYSEFYNRANVPPAAAIASATNGEYAFACVSGCTYSLASGESQQIIFSFAPTTTMTHYGYVRFNSNGGDQGGTYHNGRGIYQPVIQLTPGAFLDLGSANLGTYKEATIRVENTGLGFLNGNVSFTSGTHFSCQPPSTGCAYSVPAGGFRDITVRFSPLTTGLLDTFANFNSNAINGAVKSVQVHGRGVFAPIIDIRGGGTEFGSVVVGRFKDQQVTIRNVGTVDFAPGYFDITGAYECITSSATPPLDVNGKCNYDLPAGGETTITVRFRPLMAGPSFGTAALSGVPIANFPLTGYGMAPAVKFIEN